MLKKEKEINAQKFESIYRGLSSIAKKVFDAIPQSEPWIYASIAAEMRRLGGGGVEPKTVMFCLSSLIEAGLVLEPMRGHFQRVEVRRPITAAELATTKIEQQQENLVMTKTEPVQKIDAACASPIDRLSVFASRLRELANDMESAALDISEQAEKNDAQTAKMRQLQQLLKSLA